MGKEKSKQSSLILWAAVTALLWQNLVIPVMSTATFVEQKHYYTPDPHIKSPPTGTPGSGSYGGKPPANCGTPPSGGHHNPTPDPPSSGGSPPTTLKPPTYTPKPPTYTPKPTPKPPTYTPKPPTYTPKPPTSGGSPPTTPTPSTPSTPTTPSSPPFDPKSPPFTCDYWKTHPTLIWGLCGWWATVGGAFGVAGAPKLGSHLNLLQALSNPGTDGIGELYKQGTACLLNSMVSKKFPYTTEQVKNKFIAALGSEKAAAAQALVFKLANEGMLKPTA